MSANTTGTILERSGRRPAFEAAHLLVRTLCVINLLNIALDSVYPPYGHWLANGPFGKVTAYWAIWSAFILPAFVGLEALWMRASKVERRALLIDAAFVSTWFLAFWIAVWYALAHHVIL